MGRKWQRTDAKKFARDVQLGQPYYYVQEMSQKVARFEDRYTYSEVVFTGRLPFTNTPCTVSGFSAATLCLQFGPMLDTPPRGMRPLAGPAPQVAGPLPDGYEGVLDEDEIRGLEKRVADGSDPRKRRRLGTWRV
jgi:hypothetical protein